MTWNTFVTPVPAAEFEATVNKLEMPGANTASPSHETLEQFDAAKTAIIVLWQSGAIGDPLQGYYGATLSGHANTGHTGGENAGGGDVINLSVYRTTLVPSAPEQPHLAGSTH